MTLGQGKLRTTTRRTTSGSRAPEAVGAALRSAGRGLPGIAGALALCAGLWMAWPPLGVIMLGLLLLAIDWRIS